MKAFSNRFWLILLALLMVLSAIAALLFSRRTAPGVTATVYLDGVEVEQIDLTRVQENYTFSLTGKSGLTNLVEVSPGSIRVREADCPDQICVHQGWISTGAIPIVCLPNALVIEITGESQTQLDGVSK